MRTHFYEQLAREPKIGSKEHAFLHPYMAYWYGGTYVVIEGWKRLKLTDPHIDELLKSPNVGHLERFRHGVFHYHPVYFDEKFQDFIASSDSVQWINAVREAFSRWFLDYFNAYQSGGTSR
jgi:hypothetical protein